MTTPDPAPLLTVTELSVWAQETIESTNAWALEVIAASSDKVRATAGQPAWTASTAPSRARQIASHLAARSFKNPDSISVEGGVGPLGGDRTVEELARALHLTAAETAELEAMAPAGVSASGSSLWIQPINATLDLDPRDIYLADDSGSDWMIPYLAEDDLPALG